MFIRILENKTGNKLTIEKLIDTLREYNFYHYEGSGYVPTYTRNDATDILHEAFGFSDYSLVIAPVVADLCTTPVALSAPPNSYQNNSQS